MYKFSKSKELFKKSSLYQPGGVSSQIKSAAQPILFSTYGKGSKLYDADGNEYIDYVLGYGPCILGYAHPTLEKAIKKQIEKGTQFGLDTEDTIEFCRKLTEIIPCAKKIQLASTGSDAVHGALRLARAYTGKNKIIKFEGHFHGWHDGIYVNHVSDSLHYWGSRNNPHKLLESAGQPESVLRDLIVLPWNDAEILEKTLKRRNFEIAAVLMEPIMANFGVIMPEEDYLKNVREITEKYDVLLIFDEVITGFRIALGGAQEYFKVIPDISTFGKAIGGGVPLAGHAAKKEIMEFIGPNKCVEAGTYNANSLGIAAGLAVLSELEKEGTYERMTKLGKKLASGLKEIATKVNIPLQTQGPGPITGMRFAKEKVNDARDAISYSLYREFYPEFRHFLLQRGIHTFQTEKGEFYLSTVHTEEDIEKTLNVIEDAFKKLKNKIKK